MNTRCNTIYVSTSCIKNASTLSETINDYSRHGLKCIELGACGSMDAHWKQTVIESDCSFLVHNYFPPPEESFVLNLASPDTDTRARSIEMVCNAMKLASEIGAQFYSVHTGFVSDPVGFDGHSFTFAQASSADRRDADLRFRESIAQILSRTNDLRIPLLVENNVFTDRLAGKLLYATASEFVDFFDAMDTERVKLLLDTGHLNVTATTYNFDPAGYVHRLCPHIAGIHLHSNDGSADLHQPVSESGWIVDVLRTNELSAVPIVIESKFLSIESLCYHVEWLSNLILGDQ